MARNVWILDSTWSPEDLEPRRKRFPGLRHVHAKAEIQDRIRQLAKANRTDFGDDFWFVHQSDIGEVADLLDPLLQSEGFRLFSGASAGAHEGVLPRSLVRRQLDDFLAYWFNSDADSARQVLTQRDWWIDQVRVWTDRVQHDYINLLAPIDLLATALIGGEIQSGRHHALRIQMMDRLAARRDEFLTSQHSNLQSMAKVFEEVMDLALLTDPSAKGAPPPLRDKERIGAWLDARILHVDDEIDKGWDLVMPELFGEQYEYVTDPDKVFPRVAELERDAKAYVVLLDLGLKSGDSPVPKAWRGVSVLKQLRRQFPAAPIRVFSARSDLHSYREVMEAGANGFIQKPCRALSSESDAQIFARFRAQILGARFDIFRSFLYRAFDGLREGLDEGSIPTPFVDERDPKWRKRKGNLALALEGLLAVDFERCCRDPKYANTVIRDLILALFRPLERPSTRDPEAEIVSDNTDWKLRIAKTYRNLCAHIGPGGDVTNLDLRDVMLVAMLLLDSESLGVPLTPQIRHFLEQAYRQLFFLATPKVVREQWEARQRAPRNIPSLQKALLRHPPNVPFEHYPPEDHGILALIADKIVEPEFAGQEIVLLPPEAPVAPGPWAPYHGDVRPTESRRVETSVWSAADREAPVGRKRRAIKGMDHFFSGEGPQRVIRVGQRYAGVVVDGEDPEQRSFFAWYYDKNMKKYLSEFSQDLLSFLGTVYGVGPLAQKSEPSPSPSSSADALPDARHDGSKPVGRGIEERMVPFNIALFRLRDDAVGTPAEEAARTIGKNIAGAFVDPERRNTVFMEPTPGSGPSPRHRGVRFRSRNHFGGARFLQIDPAISRRTEFDEDPEFLSYKDATRLVATAADTIEWAGSQPLKSEGLARTGRFAPAGHGRLIADLERLRAFYKDKRIAVVDATPGGSPEMRAEWERNLTRSAGIGTASAENADALVVLIPEKSPPDLLENVHQQWKDCDRPWKAVSPGARYKDWNVLVALASRFGPIADPVAPYRQRDPNTFFIGLDLGHERGAESRLAAAIVDSRGRLMGWSRTRNPGPRAGQPAERIHQDSLLGVLRALFPLLERQSNDADRRLVIHRDGRTLEPTDDYVGMIKDEFAIEVVDWLDVDKQRAPLFFLDSSEPIGHFALFDDASGQSEMWLRTSPGAKAHYARPLCLTNRTQETDLESLGLEVFDLSNATAQDYEMKVKLPVTTYFADGFSSTGDKAVRFWGYEHLYQGSSGVARTNRLPRAGMAR